MATVWISEIDGIQGNAVVPADAILQVKGFVAGGGHERQARVSVATLKDSYVVAIESAPAGGPAFTEEAAQKAADALVGKLVQQIAISQKSSMHAVVLDWLTAAW